MKKQYDFIEAQPIHQHYIERLLKIGTMGRLMEISTQYSGNIIESMKKPHSDTKIILCLHQDKIFGMGMVEKQEVLIQGSVEPMYYLSNLRFIKEYAGSYALYYAYEYLKEQYGNRNGYFISSIMDENKHAKKVLANDRKGMPQYLPLCTLTTFIIKRRRASHESDILVVPASSVPVDDINIFLREEGKKRDCFPMYEADKETGFLSNTPGTELSNSYVAIENKSIVGFIGLLDVSSKKNLVVMNYHPLAKLIRPLYNLISKVTPYPRLPVEGEPINLNYASCVVIKNSQKKVLSSLVSCVISKLKENRLFAIAFADTDPLIDLFKKTRSLTMKSTIYSVAINGLGSAKTLQEHARKNPIYLELGAL